jgi:hypothetical protein
VNQSEGPFSGMLSANSVDFVFVFPHLFFEFTPTRHLPSGRLLKPLQIPSFMFHEALSMARRSSGVRSVRSLWGR